MDHIQTEVLVIGGGATGAGTVRDLAMRGFKTVLVEKSDLTQGTTGRYHGLLHSGGRYVVKDPRAAMECIAENQILRTIMPNCIEDTGGFFVLTPWDSEDYVPRFLAGCKSANIPVEEISISQMLREEPRLNPKITHCFRVPDASADSFLAADMNVDSARQSGAQILKYHQITDLIKTNNRVTGAICHDLVHDQQVQISADIVVNASGAWAGKIAALAGLTVSVIPGKGIMLAVNHRIVNTVINRCKMPADGDILVPSHTVSVIGTTDVKVNDPDHFAIEPWEVELMLKEGEKLAPGFTELRFLRAWAGVRPLYQETAVADTRDATRAFVLLDHTQRDGVEGFITITGGKWTTYRKMAEVTADLVCQKLDVNRPCRTHLETLPVPGYSAHPHLAAGFHHLGDRLKDVEKQRNFSDLICECELATIEAVEKAILLEDAKTIEDIRRDVRLGMGPCQGGFCTYRVAGLLHRLKKWPVTQTNLALHDFLQERWKGLVPTLWGQQLRQERLNELIYLSSLNADHLPGAQAGRLSPELYDIPVKNADNRPHQTPINVHIETDAQPGPSVGNHDLLVIGGGLAGLTAAWQAAVRGKRTRLVTKGWGSLYWRSGCIDVLGYDPTDPYQVVHSPAEAILRLIRQNPDHPYAKAGIGRIEQALVALKELGVSVGYSLAGDLEQNWLLPSGLGAIRPTCLAPDTMTAGDLRNHDPILLVGFDGYYDFYPTLIADNLAIQGYSASGVSIPVPAFTERNFITGRVIAELFDQLEVCESIAHEIKKSFLGSTNGNPKRIGFPAVLGLEKPKQVKGLLENLLGLPVFEIPTLPPSIPGIRLSRMLVSTIEYAGGRVFEGMQVCGASMAANRVVEIQSETPTRPKSHRARQFLLATGGILGGGIRADHLGQVNEVICQLPVAAPENRLDWFDRKFLSSGGHSIFRSGIRTNNNFQPLNPEIENLYIAGGMLSGGDYIQERSTDGVALVSGYFIGNQIE